MTGTATDPADPAAAAAPVVLRRNRDFTLLWLGQAASQLGSGMSAVAYPLLVLALTGSAALAGTLAAAVTAATVLARYPAGVVVDRCSRRAVLVSCDALRAVTLAALGIAVLTGHAGFPAVLAAALVEGVCAAFFAPAELAAVRHVVPAPAVAAAAAGNQARGHLAGLLGNPAGGVAFGISAALPFHLDAVSYLVSLLCVAGIRTPLRAPRRPDPGPDRVSGTEMLAGVRWLWRHRFLRATLLWSAAVAVVYSSMGLLVVVLAHQRGAGPGGIGVMLGMGGVGGLLGAVAAPWLLRRLSARAVVLGFGWCGAASVGLLLVAGSPWTMGALAAVAYFPAPALVAGIQARIATEAPDALLGRVSSAASQLAAVATPAGPLLAGLLLGLAGAVATVWCYASVMVLLAVVAMASPGLRSGNG
ncbi:MFS transporter [Dactylosporangium sp. NPDC000244]|uniref:MFS transporter n=1 Tax=Dactylosporangium sp. NPDC000244 TaxID=3154365 RepID=UPI00331D78F4